jgi:hypothetical protein
MASTLLIALLAMMVTLPSRLAAAPVVGQPAPDFTGIDTAGKTHSLSDFKGSTVVLEWTNHECPYTVKHYKSGAMQALQKDATDNGIVWLSIISSAPGEQGYVEPTEADSLTDTRGAHPSAVILDPDGDIGQSYGARTTPHMYIIDGEGRLVYMGAIDDEPGTWNADPLNADNYVRNALGEMASGQAVSVASTRPYGCSVKYAN